MECYYHNCTNCKHNRYDMLCKDNYCWAGLDRRIYDTLTPENKFYISKHYHELWTKTEIEQFLTTKCGKTFVATLGECGL